MAHGKSDNQIIQSKHNISRFFVEQRQISWVMLIAVCVWGVYSYRSMPQRKDPDTPVKSAVATRAWSRRFSSERPAVTYLVSVVLRGS